MPSFSQTYGNLRYKKRPQQQPPLHQASGVCLCLRHCFTLPGKARLPRLRPLFFSLYAALRKTVWVPLLISRDFVTVHSLRRYAAPTPMVSGRPGYSRGSRPCRPTPAELTFSRPFVSSCRKRMPSEAWLFFSITPQLQLFCLPSKRSFAE